MKHPAIITFVVSSLIHITGTVFIAGLGLRMLFRNIWSSPPVWYDIICWIWTPLPMLLARNAPEYYYDRQTLFLLVWSLCVGVVATLLVRYRVVWRRQIV